MTLAQHHPPIVDTLYGAVHKLAKISFDYNFNHTLS